MILITCELCGVAAERTGTKQSYCKECSEKRDLERKRLWARDNGQTPNPETVRRRNVARRELAKEVAKSAQDGFAEDVAWDASGVVDLLWFVRVSVPFTYNISKNAIYSMTRRGHVFLRKNHHGARNAIALAIKQALKGRRIVQNKVWIDLYVQKPNHKGDAINVVDAVCDAIKVVAGIDDRWFCIRRLDWQVAKHEPKIFIGVGQNSEIDSQVCSVCGAIKPFSEFGRRTHNKNGIARECNQCRAALRTRKTPRIEA